MPKKVTLKMKKFAKAAKQLQNMQRRGARGYEVNERVKKMRDAGLYDNLGASDDPYSDSEHADHYGGAPAVSGHDGSSYLVDWNERSDVGRKSGGGGSRLNGLSGNEKSKLIRDAYRKSIQLPTSDEDALMEASHEFTSEKARSALKRLQNIHDTFVLCHFLEGKKKAGWRPWGSHRWGEYKSLLDGAVSKILTTSGVGTGNEFIPDILSGNMVPLYREELVLMREFQHIPMSSKEFTLPLEGVSKFAYLVDEASSDAPATAGSAIPAVTIPTGNLKFTARGMKVIGVISTESDEDSIFSTIDYTRRGLVRGHGESQEDALINGDTAGTHRDDDVTDVKDHRKAWNGLRALTDATNATHDHGNAIATAAMFRNAYTKQGKFGRIANESTIAIGAVTHAQLLNDDEFKGLDKIGAATTTLTGQVGIIDGRPVVMSPFIREDLEADGNFSSASGATANRTHALVYHRGSFNIGDRRQISVEQAKDIWEDRIILLCTWRGDFKRVQAETAGKHHAVANILNVASRAVTVS